MIPAMPDQGTIWRRRVLLMGVVALLVAIPATILIRAGDDDGDAESPVATAPPLNEAVANKGLDVTYQVPEGWNESKKAKAIQLQSEDRSVLIAIAAPAAASKAGPLLDDTLASIRSGYKNVEVQPGSGKQVGGLDAKGAVISAKTPDGNELRIVVAVAKGKKRAYLVEVFTAASADPERVREAQVALNSLRLEG
jgi:predicted Zn-dependent protease